MVNRLDKDDDYDNVNYYYYYYSDYCCCNADYFILTNGQQIAPTRICPSAASVPAQANTKRNSDELDGHY